MKIWSDQIVENAWFFNVEESFKEFRDPDPDAADFQNLISFFLSKDK